MPVRGEHPVDAAFEAADRAASGNAVNRRRQRGRVPQELQRRGQRPLRQAQLGADPVVRAIVKRRDRKRPTHHGQKIRIDEALQPKAVLGGERVLRGPEVLVRSANRDASPGHVNHPDIPVCSRNISR